MSQKMCGNGVGPKGLLMKGLTEYFIGHSVDSNIGSAQWWVCSVTLTYSLDSRDSVTSVSDVTGLMLEIYILCWKVVSKYLAPGWRPEDWCKPDAKNGRKLAKFPILLVSDRFFQKGDQISDVNSETRFEILSSICNSGTYLGFAQGGGRPEGAPG